MSADGREDRDRDLVRYARQIELLGSFLDGIAHDFNNMLTVMIANLEILHDDPAGMERHARRIELMTKAAVEGARQIRQFMSFTRKIQPEPEALAPEEVLSAVNDLIGRALHDRITVESVTNLPTGSCVFIDRAQLEVCLLTLIAHADGAMSRSGAIRLGVEHADAEVIFVIRASPNDRHAKPAFADMESGQGLLGLDGVIQSITEAGGRCVATANEARIYFSSIVPTDQ